MKTEPTSKHTSRFQEYIVFCENGKNKVFPHATDLQKYLKKSPQTLTDIIRRGLPVKDPEGRVCYIDQLFSWDD